MDVLEALNLCIWCNGYTDIVNSMVDHLRSTKGETVAPPKRTYYGDEESTVYAILWCIIVCMYGRYGDTPRFGWVTDRSGAVKFLQGLIE